MDQSLTDQIFMIRNTLESFTKSDFSSRTSFYSCSGFPKGCCGDTADLLGLYFDKYHNIDSIYVTWVGLPRNPNASHAWLLVENEIIDITADQFNEYGYNLASVIITTTSDFHNSFNNIKKSKFRADSLNQTGIPSVLSKVMKNILG